MRLRSPSRLLRNYFFAGFAALLGASPTTSSRTSTIAFGRSPMARAAAGEMSSTRPSWVGARSLMRTVTDLLFLVFVTLTWVPNGRVLCAAVSLSRL